METVTLFADWQPKPKFKLGLKDVEGKLTYSGNEVWRNPRVELVGKPIPSPGPTEVLIGIRACGICGSDVHMAQADKDGYILYPGLTAFPVTLGHEIAGEVVEAGTEAINRRTNEPFEKGEPVCTEEMLWCGSCRPCVDGYPNHCERLHELGFTRDGGYAPYVAIDARYLWSLKSLEDLYGERVFLAGSLVEPTAVAYNAVIERGGGIRPGDSAVVFGGGPIGLAACAILKRAGASRIILSEPSLSRREIGKRIGVDDAIDPTKENLVERVLDITSGMGASFYLEATGLPHIIFEDIEKLIWNSREINATVVVVARAPVKTPISVEVYQVRRARIVGSQGHSGHGNFPRVIACMASGMDMTKLITKRISPREVPENLKLLQTDKEECKVTVLP